MIKMNFWTTRKHSFFFLQVLQLSTYCRQFLLILGSKVFFHKNIIISSAYFNNLAILTHLVIKIYLSLSRVLYCLPGPVFAFFDQSLKFFRDDPHASWRFLNGTMPWTLCILLLGWYKIKVNRRIHKCSWCKHYLYGQNKFSQVFRLIFVVTGLSIHQTFIKNFL